MLAINDNLANYNSLGFGGLAAMVAMYHNSPDNMPRVIRGSENQETFKGIFPRTTDLPIPGREMLR
jgi:hypothetical protein